MRESECRARLKPSRISEILTFPSYPSSKNPITKPGARGAESPHKSLRVKVESDGARECATDLKIVE